MEKHKKQRADKYEKPLKIEGAFDDVIGVAMGKKNEVPETNKKQEDQAKKKADKEK